MKINVSELLFSSWLGLPSLIIYGVKAMLMFTRESFIAKRRSCVSLKMTLDIVSVVYGVPELSTK